MKKNNINIGILLALAALVVFTTIVLIGMDDKRSSKDSESIKKQDFKKEAQVERKFVKVEMRQLRKLVSAAKDKEKDKFGKLGDPTYSPEYSLTIIKIDSIPPSGFRDLFGIERTSDKVDSLIIKSNATQLECQTKINGQDTVVQFPAYTLARLVQIYEAN